MLTADDLPSGSAIGPQTVVENRVLGPLSLTVGDDLTPAGSLVVTGSSSNTAVVEDNDIVIGGSGTSRDITVTPVALANGQTTITLNVSDGFHTTPVTFLLTVTPDDDPTITAPANDSMTRDTVLGPLAFTIGDDLTAAASLTVTATSSNHAVVKDEDVVIGGAGASRTVTITPVALATGSTTITLTVLDEFDQATPRRSPSTSSWTIRRRSPARRSPPRLATPCSGPWRSRLATTWSRRRR